MGLSSSLGTLQGTVSTSPDPSILDIQTGTAAPAFSAGRQGVLSRDATSGSMTPGPLQPWPARFGRFTFPLSRGQDTALSATQIDTPRICQNLSCSRDGFVSHTPPLTSIAQISQQHIAPFHFFSVLFFLSQISTRWLRRHLENAKVTASAQDGYCDSS